MKRIHPEDPRVTAYALGELPKHEAAEVDRAALTDPSVQEAVDETRALASLIRQGYAGESHELGEARREAIRRAGRQPVPENLVSMKASRRWVRPAAVAAAAASLVIGVVWFLQQVPVGNEGPTTARTEAERLEELRMHILMTPAPRPGRIVGVAHPPVSPDHRASSLYQVEGDLPEEKVDREYTALKKLLAENPDLFFDRVRRVAQSAGTDSLAKLPELTENPFVSTREESRSKVPIVSGLASYSLVERFVRTENKLPPKNGVRTEELINQVIYIDEGDADMDGVKLGVELVRCPWDEEAILMGVLLHNGSDREIPGDAILQVEVKEEHIRSHRLIGYAGVPGSGPEEGVYSQGLPPGRSNYVLYQLHPSNTEVFDNHRAVARVDLRSPEIKGRGLIVPVMSPPRDWRNASNNIQTAVSLGAWGMLLRDSPYKGALSTGVLETLASDAQAGAEDGDLVRRDTLQLVLDSLALLRSAP